MAIPLGAHGSLAMSCLVSFAQIEISCTGREQNCFSEVGLQGIAVAENLRL